jgi:hypothetical protein
MNYGEAEVIIFKVTATTHQIVSLNLWSFLWKVMCRSWRSEGSYCRHLQGQAAFQDDYVITVLPNVGTANPTTQRHIAEDSSLQERRCSMTVGFVCN